MVDGGANEGRERLRIDAIALPVVDRTPHAAAETVVEEVVRIREARAVRERELHLVLVGIADRDGPFL